MRASTRESRGSPGDGDGALEGLEAAPDLADHQVPDGETDLRVGGIDGPRAGNQTWNLNRRSAHRKTSA